MRARTLVVVAALCCVEACAAIATLDEHRVSVTDDAGDGAALIDATNDGETSLEDAVSPRVDSGLNDASDDGCPAERGPAMRRAGDLVRFCIDATEVTQRQYAAFLAAPMTPQPGACAANATYAPETATCRSGGNPATPFDPASDLPVVCVDWCDAHAFCAWAGKRLCGLVDGGVATNDVVGNSPADRWQVACSAGGRQAYPYAATWKQGACNDALSGDGSAQTVGSSPECTGAYPGVYDLTGNAQEWVAQCELTDSSTSFCRLRGGGFKSQPNQATCAVAHGIPRGGRGDDVGFRCCAD